MDRESKNPGAPPRPWLMESPPGPSTRISGRDLLYFAGSGYLGLQGDPRVIAALQSAAAEYGTHSATSRTLFGDSAPVREVERRAAAWFGAETSLYLPSGYAGNFAIAAALASDVHWVLIDEAAHDSLREAAHGFTNLQRPPLVFRHRDPGHLRELLAEHVRSGQRAIVLTDGVFSASGRLSPLADYLNVLDRVEGSLLLVDDAHGVATLGLEGRGSLELAGVAAGAINRALDEPPPRATRVFQSATLSKAIGGYGGVVAGSERFLSRVRSASGWHRAASAPPAAMAAATAEALAIVAHEPERRERLAGNVRHARAALRAAGAAVSDEPTPVISLELDSPAGEAAERMHAAQLKLLETGIAIAYVGHYAGAGPAGLLRIAIFATHARTEIDRLAEQVTPLLGPCEFPR